MSDDAREAELTLLADADRRARRWTAGIGAPGRRVFPSADDLAALARFDEPLPHNGFAAHDTLALLDDVGGRGVVASNDPRYYGFVVGSTLPVAAAAERMVLAWDQVASSWANSPVADVVERQAGHWVTEILDLPRDAAVGFCTSAGAGAIAAITTARRELLARHGWDVDRRGLHGAPEIRAVVSELAHITMIRALRVLGFGTDNIVRAPVDDNGRIDIDRFPSIDGRTIVCVQAGEVNTGEFDPFGDIVSRATHVGAWVHVDGAFGLWARASRSYRHLTDGIDGADSWTTDGHKWLNTPYEGAMVIVRDARALSTAMNSDAAYLTGQADAQKNLAIDFSRRARGIAMWAALRTLGVRGVDDLVTHCCELATHAADGLRDAGYTVLNRVVLNQVLVRADSDDETTRIMTAAQSSGHAWFGPTLWQGRPAFRISVSSWRTEREHIDALVALLGQALLGDAMPGEAVERGPNR